MLPKFKELIQPHAIKCPYFLACCVLLQISDTVYPMYKAFIEPDLITAHLRIYNTFNPFSGFMNATYILKSAQQVSKAQIQAVLQVYALLLLLVDVGLLCSC